MSSPQDRFVRASPERTSRSRPLTSNVAASVSPGSGSTVPLTDLEKMRQRAWRAAEFYHSTVHGGSFLAEPQAQEISYRSSSTQIDASHDQHSSGNGINTVEKELYNPQNLRAGFIDLRNSYNEKRRSKFTAYPGRPTTRQASPGKYSKGYEAHGGSKQLHKDYSGQSPRRLYRSNSSLELESLEYIDEERPLRRDYGSASSLDVVGSGPSNDSFFDLLQDYREENPDQRAPAPPQMQELLRGNMASGSNPHTLSYKAQFRTHGDSTNKVSNGSVPIEDEQMWSGDGSQSPKTKNKSQKSKDRKQRAKTMVAESTGGIFSRRKRRGEGEKSLDSSSDGDLLHEERQKRKCFVHYDCQSIGVSFSHIIKCRNDSGEGAIRRRNTTTGASAASLVRSLAADDNQEVTVDDPDDGDNNSNDLLLSCPFFRNEMGGEEEKSLALNITTAQKQVQQLLGNQNFDTQTLMQPPVCNGVSVLDMSPSPHNHVVEALLTHNGLMFEFVDQGAYYYRHFFNGQDHQNFFGVDENLGPVAVSFKREKLDEQDRVTPTAVQENGGHCYQYRIIARTSELQTIRGSILEEAIPSSSKLSSTRGLPPKELFEYIFPELNLSCLRQAIAGQKTSDQIMKLDEQGIYKSYKIGVMLCKAGQCSEEDMYNNQNPSLAFQEFLSLIGDEVRLKSWQKYKGGLDTKTDTTGTLSLYREFHGCEIMFHVSTMLPFTPSNKQQLLRKRHIGNDIVTIIFQEPGSKPFTPKSVRSQFQHIFIIIRAHHPNTPHVKYSISVSRAKDVPPFGPPIPDSVLFNKCPEFAEFLLTKAINAENAVHRSTKFAAMATRTRQEYLKDLAHNFSSNTPLDSGSKLSKFSLGSGRRKDKPKPRTFPDIFSHGAVVWNVLVEDFGQSTQVDCYLGVSAERLVVVDCTNKQVIFTIHCQAVIGWTPHNNSLQLFYHRGECLMLHTYSSEVDEVKEIVDRLSVVSYGCETVEKTLQKDSKGQLGFHVYFEGVISNVEPQSLAWAAGLRAGSRLVEICKDATATLTHDQMLNLLRNASTVKLVYIPPQEDGTARRGLVEEFRPNYSALFSPAPRSLSQREMSSPEDLLQLSTSGSGHSKGILSGTRRDLHTSLFDTSPQGTLQSQGSQSQISHVTQASHDSSGSRSSGPGSDRLGSRPDVRFSENSMQFREDGQKQLQELEASTTTQQSWKVLPAYNRDYVNAHNLSPKAEVSLWLERPLNADHSDRHGDSGYHSNNSSTSRTPRNTYSKTTNVGSSFSYRSKREVSNQSGSVTEQSSQAHPAETGTGLLGPPSMTNLSQGSDFSSHSSGSHGKAILTGSTQAAKPRFEGSLSRVKASPRGSGTISPTARSHQAYLANRHSFLDASPHGSNNSSPRNSRHLAAVSSEENLARLRPGARAGTTKSSPSGSTFQEDLMRLIDPNLSFTRSENSPDKEVGPRSSRLQRAQSDESICGAVTPRPTRHITIDSLGDVIFSTAKPARAMLSQHGQSPDMLSQEQKLSPRATSDLPPSLFRGSPGSSLKKRTLPLPDSCKGLDWNNLVDAANAFESKDRNKSASMGTGINADASSSSTVPKSSTRGHQVTLRSSKSTDLQKSYQHTDNSFSTGSSSRNQQDQTIHQNRERDSSTPPARPPAPSSSLVQNSVPLLNKTVSEGNGPVDSLQRIQELEARVFELEQSLNMEREARAASDAEAEALREDNARLHQESQTAAAQLRKFTEWFFNNIDRQ